ncbi:PAS domain S-box protein [Mesorhizobium sp. YR577]|uniref:PAS domain S-box protein n=1 Tax=Mesorhizobium sp. YR577 TaxID=1884373 RepID=UPI0008EA2EF2|nr:PAS domain S-box protein [Mesorhizobium sp. YR577]SFU00171.1 PAS/PAC sensor signal transduction histidine kinase [Mesorhizobium sp. YR577]
MPSASYSFIDVAILDDVRQRFAAGDALAILTTDLDQVIWANGPGAALLGYPDIESIIGEPPLLGPTARRQIMATSGFPRIGRDRTLAVRLATGVSSRAVNFTASALTLPDGEDAILLAVPAVQTSGRSDGDIAERAISGLDERGQFAALIDARGAVEAASQGFAGLGISQKTLAEMVVELSGERERLVKRMVPGAERSFPAGLARLVDEPARHLLVVIDERQFADDEMATAEAPDDKPSAPAAPVAEVPLLPAASVADVLAHVSAPADAKPATTAESPATIATESPVANVPAIEGDASPQLPVSETSAEAAAKGDHDNWYFNAGEAGKTGADAERKPVEIDRMAAPTRFVWRTDAEGKFSAVSSEFVEVVGPLAADVIGRRFRDVAMTFGLDPSGEIADLLDRRDTWSGRSVLWPVAGTDLKIPVDLAALPVYGRDRNFEGFRGFGVARRADAVTDPEGLGMVLVPSTGEPRESTVAEEPREQPASESTQAPDPFQGEVPALTIVPKPDNRRFADKVIRLAEHRPAAVPEKGLSPIERSAFREIGERLKQRGETAGAAESEAGEQPANDETGRQETAASVLGIADEISPVELQEAEGAASEPIVQTESDIAGPETRPAEIQGEMFAPAADAPDADSAAETMADDKPGEHAGAAEETQEVVSRDEPVIGNAANDTIPPVTGIDDASRLAHDDDRPVAANGNDADGATTEHAAAAEETPEPATAGTGESSPSDTPILEKLPVPVLIHSGDVLHYANEEFLTLTAYESVEQLAEAGGLDALFAESYDDESAAEQHHLKLRTADGLEFPIEALLRSVPWQGGKALMLVIRRTGEADIAPLQVLSPSESELHSRVAEMRTIIDTATDGVVLISNDGTIRSISRPAEALFGFDSDEVTGKPFASLFAMESQRAAHDYLNGMSDHGVASVLNDGREVIGREAQGRFIPLFMTIGRLPNESGYCAVVRDITQWKRAEEELTQARSVAERASSQKTDFLARVSHEIRTPLNAIIGFSELMVDEKFGPIANDRYRDYLRDINRSGNHVLDLVNDLLDISKIEAGQQEMAHEAVSLNDTLGETVAMMQPQANRERVIIRSSFASKLPDVVADLRSIRQIALNVLSNAIRYTQAGGQVIVSTAYEASGDIVMRVRDTGIGMTHAEIEQALKPFKQINALKRARGDGTGLGLPLTKAMVEANRARFSITSTPGEGTMVEVTFPSTRVLAE